MRSQRRRLAQLLLCALTLLCFAACDATLETKIVSSNTSGSADDGDSQSLPTRYPPNEHTADGATRSASDPVQSNRVGGSVHAVLAPNSNTPAEARSFNRVLTRLTVHKRHPVTFDIDLDVRQLQLVQQGTVEVRVRANILDAGGRAILENNQPLPNTQVTDIPILFKLEAGSPVAIINGDALNPDPVTGNNYTRTLSGPNGGVLLSPGSYTIELEIRLHSVAPVDPQSRAEIDTATATMRLR